MAQKQQKIQPKFLNLDSAFESLQPNEALYLKNFGFEINANGQLPTGTGNPSGEGQNEYTLTPTRSNVKLPRVLKPFGYNKCVGTFECINTKELYYFNYNNNGFHGIYVISGDTQSWTKIIIDAKLNFSKKQRSFITEHRVRLRVRYDENRNIIEKHLMWSEGENWQGWINVIAAIETDGFDAQQFPYWSLRQPHYDREELLQYPVRPPMIYPESELLENTPEMKGTPNWMLNTAFQFCVQFINTDGRESVISCPSLPLIVKTTDFLSNPDLIAKRALLTLYAGSALTEKIKLYLRVSKKEQDRNSALVTWTNWYLYDTLYRFQDCGDNDHSIIGNKYWLRTGDWSLYNYDFIQNTIQYTFDNTLEKLIVGQELFAEIETSMPIKSVGLSDLGDSIILANNLYNYNNLGCSVLDNLSASVVEKEGDVCSREIRKITVYAYLGARESKDYFYSNVGYFYGDDPIMRFGGISIAFGDTPRVNIDVTVSKTFDLTFGGRNALICYAKGTPYYSVGEWYQVNNDFSKVKIERPLDGSNIDVAQYIFETWNNGGFFICQFELLVPAGIYDLALGRHNVPIEEDWRNTSTYVMGIADSRIRTPADINTTPNILMVKPNAIKTFSKEMEINCLAGDVDVWGNGQDLFYVYVPSVNSIGRNWKFCEGYFYDTPGSTRGMELFSYQYIDGSGTDDWGTYTDKNGFFFLYSQHNDAPDENVGFTYVENCTYPNTFSVTGGAQNSGWFRLAPVYFSDHNGGQIGFANYVVYNITITNLAGTVGYSNIGVSIKDGATVYTNENGQASLIIHNGLPNVRVSDIYVNAGGNFLISIEECGYIPLFNYNQNNTVCQNDTERVYPFPLVLGVEIQSLEALSLKSNAIYNVGCIVADLAGRRTNIGKINELIVPSFPKRNNTNPTYASWAKSSTLVLPNDAKWFALYITKYINYRRYTQWVGDKIDFIDNYGNITTLTSSAVLCRITIDSLLEANINSNFSLLSTYQFVFGDRIRFYDNGDGGLFDTATYGDVIDTPIEGSNYNQAAVNANLIPPSTNVVLNSPSSTDDDTITLYVKYESRLDKLKDKTGFWIELYTPSENNDKLPYYQASQWMPVIQNEPAQFVGISSLGQPEYTFPSTGILTYWDTYFLIRNINIITDSKTFDHPFESPNVTDMWGAYLDSGGSPNTVNPDAKQMWYDDATIKSDDYVSEGLVNGLATFRSTNKKSFKGYWWGGIVAIKAVNSIVFYLCENDFFTTDYNFHYTYPNAQGVMIVNLTNGLSEPHQKVGNNYGCVYEDTQTVIIDDDFIFWNDRKNSAALLSDYRTAKDITQIQEGDHKVGIKSYYSAKNNFVGNWNMTHDEDEVIDIIAGIDLQLMNIYVSFRPRRNNTSSIYSFINNERNVDLSAQETFVYSISFDRWMRTNAFVPEAYGKVRGALGNEMYTFARGVPYYHNNTPSDSFCNFYGIDTERILMVAMPDTPELLKILMSLSLDSNNMAMSVDMLYSTKINSYSYIPINYFVNKDGMWYAPVLRNSNSYPPVDINQSFRQMIFDGCAMYGAYFIVRLVGDLERMTEYQELNAIYYKYAEIENSKQK